MKAGIYPYEMSHSHPESQGGFIFYPTPSGFDKYGNTLNIAGNDASVAAGFEAINPNMVNKIYVPKFKSYVQYNSQQILDNGNFIKK